MLINDINTYILMKTDQQTGILYRQWTMPDPEAVLLLIHGLGAHSERWNFLAEFFLTNGISSYALELRGFGETEGLKGHVGSFNVYYDDILNLRDIILKENPNKKIFLLGESMGGLISFMEVLRESAFFDGLICLVPAFGSRMKLSYIEYADIFVSCLFRPKKQFNMPFSSDMCTRDKEYSKVMEDDPREHRVASAKLLCEIINAQVRSMFLKSKIKVPVLFMLAGKDKLTDPGMARKIFKRLGADDRKIVEYPDMYHSLTIDFGKEHVFGDILGWLKQRIR